jgi:membrane fusion protein (multidrug efflux system)
VESEHEAGSEAAGEATHGPARATLSDATNAPTGETLDRPPHGPAGSQLPGGPPVSSPVAKRAHPVRKWLLILGLIACVVVAGYFLYPMVATALNTVSTDDAYVNGHVTYVAPRVAGQVMKVLVDDNYRVKQGALLVQLDKEPYQVQVAIKEAGVTEAKANLAATLASTRATGAQAHAYRYALERAMEDVDTQVANLGASVATLNSRKANLKLAEANLERGKALAPGGGISKEELDIRTETVESDKAAVEQALQSVYAIRAGLGLAPQPPPGHELSEAPKDLNQTFSAVRQALAQLLQIGSQLGYVASSLIQSPKEAFAEFYKQDPEGNVDRIYAKLIPNAPAVVTARAKLLEAEKQLADAQLNLRYCDVYSEIDGQVTRRSVNPGNNVQVGESLMAVRSLTEIWIDCNFKETQLADLRIGHRVRCEVDMYGSHREFTGRITGFTMGTGQSIALLPPQNATGNFVKIVQRLPVRVELVDYHPENAPLFVGLSVVPYVYYKEPPTGPNAGEFLQPFYALPEVPAAARSSAAMPKQLAVALPGAAVAPPGAKTPPSK